MGRPKVVAARGAHQLADGTIDRNRIAGRFDASEMKFSGAIRDKAATQIHLGLRGVLIFIKTFRRGMPDVDFSASNGSSTGVFKRNSNEQFGSRRRRAHQRVSARAGRLIIAPE